LKIKIIYIRIHVYAQRPSSHAHGMKLVQKSGYGVFHDISYSIQRLKIPRQYPVLPTTGYSLEISYSIQMIKNTPYSFRRVVTMYKQYSRPFKIRVFPYSNQIAT